MTSADAHMERAFMAGWLEALDLTIPDEEMDRLIEEARSPIAELVSDFANRLREEVE